MNRYFHSLVLNNFHICVLLSGLMMVQLGFVPVESYPPSNKPEREWVHASSTGYHCKQKSLRNKPNLVAKLLIYHQGHHATFDEEGYSHYIDTIIDLAEPTTLRIKCSAGYPVQLIVADSRGKILAPPTGSWLEKENTAFDGSKNYTKFRDFSLPQPISKFRVKCFATECNRTTLVSGLAILYTSFLLIVHPIDFPQVTFIENGKVGWAGVVWIVGTFLACGFVCSFGCSVLCKDFSGWGRESPVNFDRDLFNAEPERPETRERRRSLTVRFDPALFSSRGSIEVGYSDDQLRVGYVDVNV